MKAQIVVEIRENLLCPERVIVRCCGGKIVYAGRYWHGAPIKKPPVGGVVEKSNRARRLEFGEPQLMRSISRKLRKLGGDVTKQTSVLLLAALALAGCANHVWVGQNPQQDIDECTVEANHRYPPAIYTYQSGVGYTTPVRTSCASNGAYTNCTSTGGAYIPPTQSLADANADNRKTHFDSCMIARGNQLMEEGTYKNMHSSNSGEYRQNVRPRPQTICSSGKYSVRYDPKVCE